MKGKVVFALGYLCCSALWAGTMGDSIERRWVATIGGGPGFYHAGKNQIIAVEPDLVKGFMARPKNDALGNLEVFLGKQQGFADGYFGQLGLAAGYAGDANLAGVIYEDANPAFSNYRYNYKINHSYVSVKGKLIKDFGYVIMPYISGSMGVGFNDSYKFKITPVIYPEIPAPPFRSTAETTFTYQLGIGAQIPAGEHWAAGIGYEFADWGKSYLGPAIGQTTNNGLSLRHLYTHQLMFSVSYLI